jgi:hypothetical protein
LKPASLFFLSQMSQSPFETSFSIFYPKCPKVHPKLASLLYPKMSQCPFETSFSIFFFLSQMSQSPSSSYPAIRNLSSNIYTILAHPRGC